MDEIPEEATIEEDGDNNEKQGATESEEAIVEKKM